MDRAVGDGVTPEQRIQHPNSLDIAQGLDKEIQNQNFRTYDNVLDKKQHYQSLNLQKAGSHKGASKYDGSYFH